MALSHLLVRSVHVLAMAVAVGGSGGAWWLLRGREQALDDGKLAVRVATGYEWLFWAAVGTLVMTGVGNLGALAPAVPTPETQWGSVLYVKLLAVLGLLLLSAGRTIAVLRLRDAVESVGVSPRLSRAYAVTALYLLGLLVLAEVLAHG